jgi:hypothetical protein
MTQILLFINNLNQAASTPIVRLIFKQKKVKIFQNINKKIQLFNNLLMSNTEALTLW